MDRVFDQKRFDYRETLVEFGRGLNAQTDLRALLDSIVERLPQDAAWSRASQSFLRQRARARAPVTLTWRSSHGLTNLAPRSLPRSICAFSTLTGQARTNHIFLDNPQHMLRLPEAQRRSAGRLDLNYYLPCRVATAMAAARARSL